MSDLDQNALDRARAAVGLLPAIYAQFGPSHDGAVERDLIAAIAAAITAAVEEEREAVAHFIESVCVGTCDERFGLYLAAAIRFRSSQGEK